MTAQFCDTITLDDERHALHCQPLSQYWSLGGDQLDFEINCTANWRGYIAHWEIIAGRLYLTALHGKLSGIGQANLDMLFPGYPSRVFAHWFSGELIIPQGRMTERFHSGYGGTWERSMRIAVSHGIVGGSVIINNSDKLENEDHQAQRGWWQRLLSKCSE